MIDRRELLRALGASAAVAALAPLGCGHGRQRAAENLIAGPDAMRQALRDAVTAIGTRLDRPRAWVLARRRVRVLVDVAVAEVVTEHVTVGVLSARDRDGRRHERCFDEVTPARIAALAAQLVASAPSGKRHGVAAAIPEAVDFGRAVEVDPAQLAHADWLERARDVARRGESAASSRIVYRAAWLTTDDDRVWSIGEDGDRQQRLVRSRVGATFVAWHGSTPQFGEVEIAGGFGPAVVRLDDAAIARAAGEALALFTPSPPPSGRQVVLLDPGVVAALADAHARSPRLDPLARPAVTIVDDPTADGYAHFWFDDEGVPAEAVPLFGAGAGPATAGAIHARRTCPDWRLARLPTQLVIAAGSTSAAQLESGIDDGLVIEGARDVQVDDRGVAVVRVARGRQLAKGVRSGRQWGDLEVRGPATELLSDALGASVERQEVALPGGAVPQSVTAPWLLTRAHVTRARSAG